MEVDNVTTPETETPATDNETATAPQETATGDFMSNPDVIAYLDKKIAEGVSEGIQRALKGTPPKASTIAPTAAEQGAFDRMTYKERNQLFHSNPQAYHKLAKGGNK